MKSKSTILARAAVCAVGTALAHSAFADPRGKVADGDIHTKHMHNGVEVSNCICGEESKNTASISFNGLAGQERPVVKGTARGGGLDLTRNTKPMFDENWALIEQPAHSRSTARDLAHRDTERSYASSSTSDASNVGASDNRAYSTQSVTSDNRDLAKDQALRDSTARARQVNDDRKASEFKPSAAPKEERERDAGLPEDQNQDLNKNEQGVQAVPTGGSTREARVDADIAQQLNAAIKADDGFSADAKNIKVMVENDTVILRGSVASQIEKASIEQKAKQLAGIKQVKNELEIKQ